jgi:hypothetical protein
VRSMRRTGRVIAVTAMTALAAAGLSAAAGSHVSSGWIAFDERVSEGPGDSWEIFVIRPDGSGRRMVTPKHVAGDKSEATWSPDGNKIAFQFQSLGSRKSGIFVVNIDGTANRLLPWQGDLVDASRRPLPTATGSRDRRPDRVRRADMGPQRAPDHLRTGDRALGGQSRRIQAPKVCPQRQ